MIFSLWSQISDDFLMTLVSNYALATSDLQLTGCENDRKAPETLSLNCSLRVAFEANGVEKNDIKKMLKI